MIQIYCKCLACSKGLLQLQTRFSKHAKKLLASFCTSLRSVVHLPHQFQTTSFNNLLQRSALLPSLGLIPVPCGSSEAASPIIEKSELQLYLALTWSALMWQALAPAEGLTSSSLQDLPKLHAFHFVIYLFPRSHLELV